MAKEKRDLAKGDVKRGAARGVASRDEYVCMISSVTIHHCSIEDRVGRIVSWEPRVSEGEGGGALVKVATKSTSTVDPVPALAMMLCRICRTGVSLRQSR